VADVEPTASPRDVLRQLWFRKQIDRAQFLAGREVERLFEVVAGPGVRAIDPRRPRVDGGPIAGLPLNFKAVKHARGKLKVLKERIGVDGWGLIEAVLIRGCSLKQAAIDRNMISERDERFIGALFRMSLQRAAKELGLVPLTESIVNAVQKPPGQRPALRFFSVYQASEHLSAYEDEIRCAAFEKVEVRPAAKGFGIAVVNRFTQRLERWIQE